MVGLKSYIWISKRPNNIAYHAISRCYATNDQIEETFTAYIRTPMDWVIVNIVNIKDICNMKYKSRVYIAVSL